MGYEAKLDQCASVVNTAATPVNMASELHPDNITEDGDIAQIDDERDDVDEMREVFRAT